VPKLSAKCAARNEKTGRDARPSMLPAVLRLQGRHHFDAHRGVLISTGTVEIRADVRNAGFVCGGVLRHIKHGCGVGCVCVGCKAVPRRDGTPAAATIETCMCVRCQRRRAARSRADA